MHFKAESSDYYLYRFYGYLEANADDSFDVTLIDTAGLVMDTLKSPVGISEDSGHMNIISTIYALTAMPSGATDPLNTDSIATLSDSAKLKLLITAMVDLSLAHNSPKPDENEQSQGIFTNYMQFMDNVVGKWSTIGSVVNGILRLRNIHDAILEHNREEIIDPVEVINRGTCLDGTKNAKRQNYAFYEGYTRLDAEVSYLPSVSATSTGAGVMFRVSDNIEVYEADIADTFNTFKEPFIPCTTGSRRIIIKANDSLLGKLNSDGIWVKGVGDGEDQQFYIGISKVRLPLKAVAGAKPIGVAFALGKEGAGRGDPAGTIVGGAESNFFKMYTLIENPDGSVDTIINSSNPEVLLHHQKRIIEIDSNYIGKDASFKFDVIGTDTLNKKIFIESSNSYRAVIKDTSQEVGKTLVRVSYKNALTYVGERWLLVSKLFSDDAQNGNLRKKGIAKHSIEIVTPLFFNINLIPEMSDSGNVVIKIPQKLDIYTNEQMTALWGDFKVENGRKVMRKNWKEYQALLGFGRSLYFASDYKMNKNVTITLNWPPSIFKGKVTVPYNSSITENIAFEINAKDNIVLEPITNEVVSGTTAEVYNPSCVAIGDLALFKIKITGTGYSADKVKWISKNKKVKFITENDDKSAVETDEGSGFEVKVKGISGGSDALEVSIEGYDGIKPKIDLYVVTPKTVNVHTCIIKNREGDSAFTDSEIDNSFEVANQILKQIGVRLSRIELDIESNYNDEYYEIPIAAGVRLLANQTKVDNGLEVYFIKGHRISYDGMIAENRVGEGIIITKFGNLSVNIEEKSLYGGNVLAHEIMHSCRNSEDSSSLKEYVSDIYVNEYLEEYPLFSEDMPNDYGNGYYREKIYMADIINRLLMFGNTTKNTKGYDIPFGPIYGVSKNGSTKKVNCGINGQLGRFFNHDK